MLDNTDQVMNNTLFILFFFKKNVSYITIVKIKINSVNSLLNK